MSLFRTCHGSLLHVLNGSGPHPYARCACCAAPCRAVLHRRMLWIDRAFHVMFWERVLSGGYRVATPEEADYFFVPGNGRGCPKWSLLQVRPWLWPLRPQCIGGGGEGVCRGVKAAEAEAKEAWGAQERAGTSSFI